MSRVPKLLEELREEERNYERLKNFVNVKRYFSCIKAIHEKKIEIQKEIEKERVIELARKEAAMDVDVEIEIKIEEDKEEDKENVNPNPTSFKCFYCKKSGHYAKNCWVKQALQEKEKSFKKRESKALKELNELEALRRTLL